jgi:hypothetical protein
MQTSFKGIDEIFDFKGLWDVQSKCGLKIIQHDDKYIIVVTELYLDNPGTSITQATCALAKQICEKYQLPKNEIVYIEHNPDMNSKLSFYGENFYLVAFDVIDNNFVNPQWKQLGDTEIELMEDLLHKI